jgi:DNA-binding IclR family transcriptional regulator
MRRAKGEAAQLILHELAEANPRALSYSELSARTSLPVATLHDNVKALVKQGKIRCTKGRHGMVLVTLS